MRNYQRNRKITVNGYPQFSPSQSFKHSVWDKELYYLLGSPLPELSCSPSTSRNFKHKVVFLGDVEANSQLCLLYFNYLKIRTMFVLFNEDKSEFSWYENFLRCFMLEI